MAKQTINPGTTPTGAGGDTFRSGSAKLQANDDELYSQLGATPQGVLPAALPVNKGGTGGATAADARNNLGLGSAATAALTASPIDLTAYRVIRTGDLGIGPQLVLSDPDINNIPNFGFYISALGIQNGPANLSNARCMISSFGDTYKVRDIIDTTTARKWFKVGSNLGFIENPWHEYITTRNSAVDANGFIKNASPIIQLFADVIELNDEAEQQDISFEKLGVGDYLIKGSSGFAQEGWYVETPKDANGNVLFSVIYTTLENGDISVKTYKKKFDFETVSIVADLDNPVDITENRWIDLRLQELPQPEIEELESIAPPEFQPTGLAQAVATVMESYHDPEQ